MKYFSCLMGLAILFSGCSDFQDPTKKLNVESVVTGGDSLTQGMTKDQVIAGWGHADDVKSLGDTKWGAPIEQWTYHAFLPKFPVNFRYVSKGCRLVFEGDALVKWENIDIEKKEQKSESSQAPSKKVSQPTLEKSETQESQSETEGSLNTLPSSTNPEDLGADVLTQKSKI